MKKNLSYLLLATFLTFCIGASQPSHNHAKPIIESSRDIASIFPETPEEIDRQLLEAQNNALKSLKEIISIEPNNRTFENTVRAFDYAVSDFNILGSTLAAVKMVYPDKAMSYKAAEALAAWGEFSIDQFQSNKNVYRAFKEYQTGNALTETLSAERNYYLTEIMSAFQRDGLELDSESFSQLIALQKKIDLLGIQFSTNIAQDKSSLLVTKEGLLGVDEEFIDGLEQTDEGYVLLCNYPTRLQIMENCSVEETRRDYLRAFNNRAFPINQPILNELINTRDDLAQLLGYKCYAELDLSSEMADTPARVEDFIDQLTVTATRQADEDWALLLDNLPSTISLTADGKINSWDSAYIANHYMKENLNIDNDLIAEYFPMENCVEGMLSIFGKFLSLKFEVLTNQTFWDPAVKLIQVNQLEGNRELVGYILMDLFPRENKYSHACCQCVVPPMTMDGGKTYQPALAMIITNFTKPTESKPALLKHSEVETLFHEFGHTMHALLGKAEMPTDAAYNTKIDFVETPSQLLEEWAWNAEVLKLISRHYQTGEPLPDSLIQRLISTKHFGEGIFVARQLQLAKISLNCFGVGKDKDVIGMGKAFYEKGNSRVAFDPENHFYYSFGHLVGYSSRYYGYLWSKDLANKIFAYIQSHGGPLDPVMGQRYITNVIGKGGSCDPNQMMSDFLAE